MTNAPAGWYPDSELPNSERWWDGNQWTDHRRPAGPPPATQPNGQPTVPLTPAARLQTSVPAAQKPLWKRTWFIIVAAVAALIVVGSVSGAIAGGQKPDTVAAADSTPIATPTPTASPAEPSPTPTHVATQTPAATQSSAPSEIDPTYFKANAEKQLDDYAKDLGDLGDAVAKGSTLRVMSNSVELAFNEGQLAGIAPTENVAPEWSTALAGLAITTSQISDAISMKDYTTVNNLIGQANQQVVSLRDIASRAA